MTRFLAMGGYGSFVWSAYGVSATALAVAVALTLRGYFCAVRRLRVMRTGNESASQ